MPNVYAVHNADSSTERDNVQARMRDLAAPVNYWFVFLETTDGQPLPDMFNVLKSKQDDGDYIWSMINFNGYNFQLMSDIDAPYIEQIKVMVNTYRGGDYMKVCIRVRNPYTNKKEDKIGFMTREQHKKLCIFVISKSNSDDLLVPGLNP